jgi:hypothetical protein
VRIDGGVIASNWTELTTAFALKATITIDENGQPLMPAGSVVVWTGQPLDAGANFCDDWVSSVANVNGWSGQAWEKTAGWQAAQYTSCATECPLYCFEVSAP